LRRWRYKVVTKAARPEDKDNGSPVSWDPRENPQVAGHQRLLFLVGTHIQAMLSMTSVKTT